MIKEHVALKHPSPQQAHEDYNKAIDLNPTYALAYNLRSQSWERFCTQYAEALGANIPSGIVATCQDERSQLKNKQRAMGVLRARLLDVETTKKQAELAADRRSQVGTGDRSEKVRTYNYPQNRVTDHSISVTSHNLDRILAGEIDDFIENTYPGNLSAEDFYGIDKLWHRRVPP